MNKYKEIYDYSRDVLTNIVNEFINKSMSYSNIYSFLNLVIGFENYLNNAYSDIAHSIVRYALYDICEEKNCLEMWVVYNRSFSKG